MRTKILLPLAILIAAFCISGLYSYSLYEGLPKILVAIGFALQLVVIVGVTLLELKVNKLGFILISIGSLVFVPIGLVPILLARKIVDADKKSDFLTNLQS